MPKNRVTRSRAVIDLVCEMDDVHDRIGVRRDHRRRHRRRLMGSAHAANYKALDGRARVKTVVSRNLERAARIAETVGADATTDFDSVLRDPEVEAIDLCLPTPLHRDAAERALGAGRHVFPERSFSCTRI
jgi:predicted dehydrogenase